MKSIPVQNANRQLLCDDEDYEKLAAYKWYLCRNGNEGRMQLRARCPEGMTMTPMGVIFDLTYRVGLVFTFRDGNVCNYQRYNLRWRNKDELPLKLLTSLSVSHCPLGPTILRPTQTDGRSACCFVCMDEDYDSYYQCLDIVAHKTYWKGWIRHDA